MDEMTVPRQAKHIDGARAPWTLNAPNSLRGLAARLMDARGLLGQSAQTCIAGALVALVNLIISVLTARTLGAHGRGEITALLLWLQLLPFLGTLGLPSAFTYYAKKHPHQAPGLLARSLLLLAIGGGLVTLAAWGLAPAMFSGQPPDWGTFARSFLILGVPVAVLLHFFTNAAQSFAQLNQYNLARFAHPVCYLALLLALWLVGTLDVKTAALAYVIAGVPLLIWLGAYFWRLYRPSLQQRAQDVRAYVSFGAHAYGVDAIAVLINQIDKLWLLKTLSIRELGLYSVAFGLSRVLVLFQNSVSSVLFAATAGKDPRVVSQQWDKPAGCRWRWRCSRACHCCLRAI
jgi:O-antigen/teichoic acid export membrane protein